MKKYLSIIGCIILFAASSCTKKYITPNPNQTIFIKIPASAWTLQGTSYTAPLDIPELTSDANHYGGVLVSISYPATNPNDEVYEQLPEVYGGTSFSFTYNSGNVTLYAQSPDGTTAVQPTEEIDAKVILVASN